MLDNIWALISTLVGTGIIGGGLAWLIFFKSERAKRTAEAAKTEAEAEESGVNAEKAQLNLAELKDKRFKTELTEAYAQIDEMDKKMDELRVDIFELKEKLFQMTERAVIAEQQLKKVTTRLERLLEECRTKCAGIIDLTEYQD